MVTSVVSCGRNLSLCVSIFLAFPGIFSQVKNCVGWRRWIFSRRLWYFTDAPPLGGGLPHILHPLSFQIAKYPANWASALHHSVRVLLKPDVETSCANRKRKRDFSGGKVCLTLCTLRRSTQMERGPTPSLTHCQGAAYHLPTPP